MGPLTHRLSPLIMHFFKVHVSRKKIMGHPQLSFQQDCRSFWQKEPVKLYHIVLLCLLVTGAFMGIWMWWTIGIKNVNHW